MEDTQKTDALVRLREELLGGIVPLVDSGNLEPAERFDFYSRLAQSKGSLEYYQKAYEAAQQMNESGDKLQAYMSLLGDIDFELQSELDEGQTAQPSS